MERYIKILAVLALFVAFGCSKSDEEGPGAEVPRSVTEAPFENPYVIPVDPETDRQETDQPTPAEINDDGDDESGPNDNRAN
jgi:hypothetical protein